MQKKYQADSTSVKRQWTSRSIGSKLQHNIFYLLIRVGGRRLAYFILYFVVFHYAVFSRSQRKQGRTYISRKFGKHHYLIRFYHRYRMMLNLGKALIDRAIVGILGPGAIKVTLHDREKLLQLLGEKKGLILMLSHVGCWQVAMAALKFLDNRVYLLMHHEEGDFDLHYFEHSGTETPFHFIDPHGYLGGSLEMMQVLKKGDVLCVMGDRVLGSEKNTVAIDFLGDQAEFPYSAYKIASVTGAPIVTFYALKTGPASYSLKLTKTIRVPENLGRSGEKFTPYVKMFVESLEDFTKEKPYQFFNFYDMWDPLKEADQ